jgi:hypothetical protein
VCVARDLQLFSAKPKGTPPLTEKCELPDETMYTKGQVGAVCSRHEGIKLIFCSVNLLFFLFHKGINRRRYNPFFFIGV